MSNFNRDLPYNKLPDLPTKNNLETVVFFRDSELMTINNYLWKLGKKKQ
jgi:hypothetical protein